MIRGTQPLAFLKILHHPPAVLVLGAAAVTAVVLVSVFAFRRRKRIEDSRRIAAGDPPYPGFDSDEQTVGDFEAFAEAGKWDVIEARRGQLEGIVARAESHRDLLKGELGEEALNGPPPLPNSDPEDPRRGMLGELNALVARGRAVLDQPQ